MNIKNWLLAAVLVMRFPLAAHSEGATSSACSSGERFNQGFEYSIWDNRDVEFKDIFYGTERCPVFDEKSEVRGEIPQLIKIFGVLQRPEKLYVKWLIKSTGKEYEDTVDLSKRLPKNLTGNRLYFKVDGSQLTVFLITSEHQNPDTPEDPGPQIYTHFFRTVTIYPDPH